jgi:hypothetical protein
MRFIKLAFISLVFLFAVVTAISLIIPSHIKLSKVVTISAQKDSIFSLIKNKNQWPSWHPSFVNNTNGELLSQISVELVFETDSSLQMRWMQKDKKPLNMHWQLFGGEGLATLQWGIDFYQKWYPWEKIGSLFYEGSYGAMMEQGLANIKASIEKNQTH